MLQQVLSSLEKQPISKKDFISQGRREVPDFGGNERVLRVFAPHVEAAREEGEVREDLIVDDVLTGVRMVYGLVVTSGGGGMLAERIDAVSRRWFGMAPLPDEGHNSL